MLWERRCPFLKKRKKEKGITISALLEQFLNEEPPQPTDEKLREYDFKFRESPAFKL